MQGVRETTVFASSTAVPTDASTSFTNFSDDKEDTTAAAAAAIDPVYGNRPAHCYYDQPPLTNERFWLVTVFGTAVSIVSIIENLFLFYLFLTRKRHRTTYNLYFMLLAFFDVFVSAAYILLMSVNVLTDYLQSVSLMRLWFGYMVPIITISHIGMTSSSFLILAATFERYCITVNSKYVHFAQRHRKMIAAFAILLGVISKGTMCLEFNITYMEECAGLMTEIGIGFEDFVMNTPYHTVWRFWYRNFVTVFMPFFCLAYLNARIVKALTENHKLKYITRVVGSVASKEIARRKAVARSATRTLVFVVCTYLISNIINVMLTVWEHLDKMSLMTTYVNYYAIALDVVSLLTNLASASRLPIYLSCQSELRKEVYELLRNSCSRNSSKEVNLRRQSPFKVLKERNGLNGEGKKKRGNESDKKADGKTMTNGRHVAIHAEDEGTVAISECANHEEDGSNVGKTKTLVMKTSEPAIDGSDGGDDDDGSSIEMVGEETLL